MQIRYLLIGVIVLFIVGVLTTSSYAMIDPKIIVGLWLFDEGNGNIAADSSGNKNNGVIKNAKWTNGKIGKALEFDGTAACFVEIPDSESLDITDAITLEAWVYPLSFMAYGKIVMKPYVPYASPYMTYGMFFEAKGGTIGTIIATGANIENRLITATEIPLKEWTHVAMTYDGKEMKTYFNGKLQISLKVTGKIVTNDNPVVMGRDLSGLTQPMNAISDEVAVWSVARTEDEIKKDMAGINPAAVVASGKLATTWSYIKTR